ncbi:MAG: RNase A-like domain-containing protein [Hyphomicrobiaceae bacterium]
MGEGGGDGLVHLTQGDPLSGYPIDLREEARLGGHTIDEHVNVNPEYLAARVRREPEEIRERGDDFRGLSVGSFASLTRAIRFVNSTVSQGQDLVNEVAQGRRAFAIIEARFDSVTGYESYLATYHAQPYMRDTYGVRVFILRDRRTARGYRVQSAFPIR